MEIEKNMIKFDVESGIDFVIVIKSLGEIQKVSIPLIMRRCNFGFGRAEKVYKYLVENDYILKDGTVDQKLIQNLLKKDNNPADKFIFLDVDGVLNCKTTKDKCGAYVGIEDQKVQYLKELVDITGAKIVLTSTWKEYWERNTTLKHRQDEMANYLDEKLSKQGLKVIDKTDDYFALDRGDGILEYIRGYKRKGNNVEKFVIFDDEMLDYKETKLTKHLIQTSFKNGGLQQKHIRKAIEILC